jgi:hypothetical protein
MPKKINELIPLSPLTTTEHSRLDWCTCTSSNCLYQYHSAHCNQTYRTPMQKSVSEGYTTPLLGHTQEEVHSTLML